MRPTNRSTGRSSRRSSRRAASAVAGREQRRVDPLRHDLDALRIGAVVADELIALGVGCRDDEIGAANDLRLDAGPQGHLVVEPDLGAYAVERVERRDERQVELVLQAVADRTRDPVVRVQHVVGRPAPLEEGAGTLAERRDELGKLLPWHRRAGPGGDVQDAVAGLHHHDRRLLGVLQPREHVDRDTRSRQRRRERVHVHVQASGVATPRLGQGGGVDAQHRHPLHSGANLTGGRSCSRAPRPLPGQQPALLRTGYGSVLLPLSPPMRISKWRWGPEAFPVIPVYAMTSPCDTLRAPPTNCERCA